MARPKKLLLPKILDEEYQALVKEAGFSDRITMREMAFARLVAEEGADYTEAYKQTFLPKTDNIESIHQMASRIAKRPRVKAMISRIKREIEEDELRKEERLAVALHPAKAYERIAIELYAMATDREVDPKCRVAAAKLFGSMKHVDAFVGPGSSIETDKRSTSGIGVKASDTSDEAKAKLYSHLRSLLNSKMAERVIDTAPIDISAENVIDVEQQPVGHH